jgi:hypothetical protein
MAVHPPSPTPPPSLSLTHTAGHIDRRAQYLLEGQPPACCQGPGRQSRALPTGLREQQLGVETAQGRGQVRWLTPHGVVVVAPRGQHKLALALSGGRRELGDADGEGVGCEVGRHHCDGDRPRLWPGRTAHRHIERVVALSNPVSAAHSNKGGGEGRQQAAARVEGLRPQSGWYLPAPWQSRCPWWPRASAH